MSFFLIWSVDVRRHWGTLKTYEESSNIFIRSGLMDLKITVIAFGACGLRD
ncbi:hypothetical protein [Syntrophomonas zehnderi]|uniref:hypothetical protein n=1 Tax=Syntrophomonas zehnderi TaxID=404335 RepID=UPI000ABBCB3D|nr:hypothetical protein [Syntrophomonas zehnderi]